MRKLALSAMLGTALLCSATISTPAYAFHDPGGTSMTTTHYGTTGDINQATALPDDHADRVYSSFNIDNLGASIDGDGGAAAHSAAPATSLVDGPSDTR